MKWVDDWKDWWKWHSTKIAGLMAAFMAGWSSLPNEFKSLIPESWYPFIGVVFFIAFVIARTVKQ